MRVHGGGTMLGAATSSHFQKKNRWKEILSMYKTLSISVLIFSRYISRPSHEETNLLFHIYIFS